MVRILPPPAERFDPITARWVTPGGPLHDPLRDSVDPSHAEPLELVAPLPAELTGVDAAAPSDPRREARRSRRHRLLLLAFVGFGVVALLIAGSLIT